MIIMVVAGMNLRRDLPPQIGSEGLETRQISSRMYASQESAWTGLSCAKWCVQSKRVWLLHDCMFSGKCGHE